MYYIRPVDVQSWWMLQNVFILRYAFSPTLYSDQATNAPFLNWNADTYVRKSSTNAFFRKILVILKTKFYSNLQVSFCYTRPDELVEYVPIFTYWILHSF